MTSGAGYGEEAEAGPIVCWTAAASFAGWHAAGRLPPPDAFTTIDEEAAPSVEGGCGEDEGDDTTAVVVVAVGDAEEANHRTKVDATDGDAADAGKTEEEESVGVLVIRSRKPPQAPLPPPTIIAALLACGRDTRDATMDDRN